MKEQLYGKHICWSLVYLLLLALSYALAFSVLVLAVSSPDTLGYMVIHVATYFTDTHSDCDKLAHSDTQTHTVTG